MVSVTIIELLEVVYIHHQERKTRIFALRALELQLKLLLKITARPEPGQIVGKRKAQQSFICLLARKQIVRDES